LCGGDGVEVAFFEPLAQNLLVELADAGLRHLVDEGDLLGHPPLGDVVEQERPQLLGVAGLALDRDDARQRALAPAVVGRAMTAASATFGWAMSAFSRSTEEIHSPPDLMTSLERSEILM